MAKKRSRIEVIYSMLEAISQKGGSIKPTHLMYKANLSHTSLKSYVNELIEKGLIIKKSASKGDLYELTDKGYKFLEEYRRFSILAETFGL